MAAEELFAAINANEPELVRALIAAGADVALARSDGWTALIVASWTGQLECVRPESAPQPGRSHAISA